MKSVTDNIYAFNSYFTKRLIGFKG